MLLQNKKSFIIIFIACCLLGPVLLFIGTSNGVGISSDSHSYFRAAKTLSFSPRWPPLYPLALHLVSRLGIPLSDAARIFNIMLLFFTIMLSTLVVGKATAFNRLNMVLCGLILSLSTVVLEVHSMAWSEGLFLVFLLLAILFLILYKEKERFQDLIYLSVAMSLLFLTRYSGIIFIIITIPLLSKNFLKKISNFIVYLLITLVPMILYLLLYNWFTQEASARESVSFHPVSLNHIKFGLLNISGWFLPEVIVVPVRVTAFAGGVFLGLVYLFKNKKRVKATFISSTLAIYAVMYLLFITAMISFIYIFIIYSNRILIPVFLLTVILVFSGLHFRRLIGLKVIILLFYLVFYSFNSSFWIKNKLSERTNWYDTWNTPKIMSDLQALAPTTLIVTNATDVVHSLLDREALRIPRLYSLSSLKPNENLAEKLNVLKDTLYNQESVVIYFLDTGRYYYPSLERLKSTLDLEVIAEHEEAVFLKSKK